MCKTIGEHLKFGCFYMKVTFSVVLFNVLVSERESKAERKTKTMYAMELDETSAAPSIFTFLLASI